MAYLPRELIITDDSHFHVTWQCHNKDWLLRWDWAKQLYYDLILKYKDKYGIQIYSYNFMDNHPHLTGYLRTREEFSSFFRDVHSQFARAVNKKLGRRGQVIMDRFKSPKIESDEHMLRVMTYIDLNQYRVRKVDHPKKNRWSSYGYYAHGKKDPLITPSPSYLALSKVSERRMSIYREMVVSQLNNKAKINISNTYFIGNPEWVVRKNREYREILSAKYRSKNQARAPS